MKDKFMRMTPDMILGDTSLLTLSKRARAWELLQQAEKKIALLSQDILTSEGIAGRMLMISLEENQRLLRDLLQARNEIVALRAKLENHQ